MCLLICYGTRPEWIKLKPVIDELRKRDVPHRVLHVGQHKDIGESDYILEIVDRGSRLDSIVGSVMSKFNDLFYGTNITSVMVQGDTTTALAAAMAANHHKMGVIHLEAGLRTYNDNNPWPEERNRRMISVLADVHLCPTEENAKNLISEEITGSIFVTGNTAIDSIAGYRDKCEYTNKVLVTLHRRENHKMMDRWFRAVEEVAFAHDDMEFILPIHKNPDVYKHKDIFKYVNVVEPMSHDDLLDILVKTRLVITDSGGIQEECSYFHKKCLVCRITTERPEALGKSSFLVRLPSDLPLIFDEHVDNYEIDYGCPFGDGSSAKSIVDILQLLK